MGEVESRMLAYLQRRLGAGAFAVPEREIMDALIPADHPEFRARPAYRHGLQRLRRRLLINAIVDHDGTTHYFIGTHPSPDLRRSLGS
jgi:hypothetical protein